jgi:uncharacterized protein (TIGR00661 family)
MTQKKILICPLNWGIGHASRCVPVIKTLVELGQEVIIAADKAPLAFLQAAFPKIETIRFPGFEPFYSSGKSQVLNTARLVPSLIKSAGYDNRFVEKLVTDRNINAVISDNRFGASSKKVPSVFITHQIHINLPWSLRGIRPLVSWLNKKYIRNFSACWVPDFENEPNISGMLSHPPLKGIKVDYIGPLSRFSCIEDPEKEPAYDVLAILSGPEPQRTLLEMKLIKEINGLPLSVCILRGKPDYHRELKQTKRLHLFNHAHDEKIQELMQSSKLIISRPGYSTIMDLIAVQKKAFFVPTPGQTEQEYLARRMRSLHWFNWGKQDQFDVMYAINEMSDFHPPKLNSSNISLRERLLQWLQEI